MSFSGSNCTGPTPEITASLVGPGGEELNGTVTFGTPDPAGAWSVGFTVPPVATRADYQVRAGCIPDVSVAQCSNPVAGRRCGQINYANQPFQVLAGELATMSVSPLRAEAGADVPLTVSGTLCKASTTPKQGISPSVSVRVVHSGSAANSSSVAEGSASPSLSGFWTVEIVLPSSSRPGTYTVIADCSLAPPPQLIFQYEAVDVTLSPRLTFTG